MLDLNGVDLRLNTRVTADDLLAFDETILATGIARACRRSPGSIIPRC
jgi:2,4-dienoyl-CoA reductase (NADPH2)